MTTERLGESPVAIVNKDSVGIVETKYFAFAQPPGEFVLDNGSKLGPIKIAYETYGRLNKNRNNVILIEHALTASAHAAGRHSHRDDNPGWWDSMVGPGRAFDSDKYYIICSNLLGSCYGTTGPSSLNPKTKKAYGYSFPVITIRDMVGVQKRLVEHLGVNSIEAE